jgi:hypothetical protein
MNRLSNEYSRCIGWWEQLNIPDHHKVVMCQIECLFVCKWEHSQSVSKRLNLTFAVEGFSHFPLGAGDAEIFYIYYGQLPKDFKRILAHGAKGIHVETFNHLLEEFKQLIGALYA